MDYTKALEKHGMFMPDPPAKGGIYEPVVVFGENLAYFSGCGPVINGKKMMEGKLGEKYTVEEGQKAGQWCVMNMLANLENHFGSLSSIKKIVKLTCFVAGTADFYDQPQVANGASQLLADIFGEEVGISSRSAVGVSSLPGNIPVEIEMLVELHPQQ